MCTPLEYSSSGRFQGSIQKSNASLSMRREIERGCDACAMDDQDFRRQMLLVDEFGQCACGVIHVGCIHLAYLLRWDDAFTLVMHRELGIHREVHVWPREKGKQPRNLLLQRAVADLNVEKEE